MERLRPDQDACVLVRSDGRYHFEVLYYAKTEIFEGVLPPDELEYLVRLVSQEPLLHLQQNDIPSPLLQLDIPSPLLQSRVDQLVLSILRQGYWQNLSFPNAESRSSLRDILDPLLNWFGRIQQKKGRGLTEESGRNNCNAPREIQLKQRADKESTADSGESIAADSHGPVLPAYVLQMVTSQVRTGQIENTCLIVFGSGAYHRVRRSQKVGSKEEEAIVLDGSFSADDMHALRVLLDDKDLQRYTADSPPRRLVGEATLTHLTVPRSLKSQQMYLWRDSTYVVGPDQVPRWNDHGGDVVRPLNKWLKAKLPDDKGVRSPDPANPGCVPAP